MAAPDAFELRSPSKDDLEAAAEAWRDKVNLHELPGGSTWHRVVTAATPAQALDYAKTCYASGKCRHGSNARSACSMRYGGARIFRCLGAPVCERRMSERDDLDDRL